MTEAISRSRLIDVAGAAGVSRQTAGAVLLGGRTNTRVSQATVERVFGAARQLDYRPNHAARQLKGLATGLIGILCKTIREPSHNLIATRLMRLLVERNYTPFLISITETSGKTLDSLVADMAGRGMDGLLVIDERFLRRPESLRRLLEICPCAVFYAGGRVVPSLAAHFVDVDRALALRLAVRRLAKRGCRRIGVFDVRPHRDPETSRLNGYREELLEQGLPFDERLVFSLRWRAWDGGDHLPEARDLFRRAIARLLGRRRADAIISAVIPAPLTVGLIQELREQGHGVPEDVAVIAVRDDPIYQFIRPTLSAIEIHHDAVAKPMVDMLERMLANEPRRRTQNVVLVKPEVIARESA